MGATYSQYEIIGISHLDRKIVNYLYYKLETIFQYVHNELDEGMQGNGEVILPVLSQEY